MENSKPDKFSIQMNQETYYPKFKVTTVNGVSIIGIIQIPSKNKVNENLFIQHDTYSFYIDKTKNLIIIEGSQTQPLRILQKVLKEKVEIKEIEQNKDTMTKISDSIRNNSNCIIHDPRFEFAGTEGYEGLSREGFTVTRTRCATTRVRYDDMLKRASMFEPIFRIFQICGIIDEKSEKGKLLKINRHFGFSMYVDAGFDKWVEFIIDVISSALCDGEDG